jgi:hypothetical protein
MCAAETHVMSSVSFWKAEELTMKVLLFPVLRFRKIIALREGLLAPPAFPSHKSNIKWL